MKTFKVLQSNPNQKDGFVTKLQAEVLVKDELFGDKIKKETYYISGTKQVAVGTEIPESAIFPKYRVEAHPAINPSTKEEFMAKWLHVA